MSKPTELDANRLLDSSMREHYKAAAYHLASHQRITPDEAMQMAQRASHVGCNGACEWAEPCTCSHSARWAAPRQPRRPEPRTPHLPLWTRVTMAWPAATATRLAAGAAVLAAVCWALWAAVGFVVGAQ